MLYLIIVNRPTDEQINELRAAQEAQVASTGAQ